MSRLGRTWILIFAAVTILAATYGLAEATSAWQGATTSIGTLLAAAATAWAAHEARSAARSSADSSRHARLALALHNRPRPMANLWREDGHENSPWAWFVTNEEGATATALRMTWTVDGLRREAARSELKVGDIWRLPVHVSSGTDVSELWRRVGSATIEWQDAQGLMRWSTVVDVNEGVYVGSPAPYGTELSPNPSKLPSVGNSEPTAVW